jgi:long-chain fatty acid transport protein
MTIENISESRFPCWLPKAALVFIAALTGPGFLASTGYADGFRNPFHGSAAIAQGNAFVAQADDPSAIHYNPAGMTQLHGLQNAFGVQFVNIDTRFKNPDGVGTSNDLGGPFGLPPPGQLFVTANMEDLGPSWLSRFTFGFGLLNLFGFGADYPSDGPLATAITSAIFPLLDLKPTIAYKATENLSFGLGADIFTFFDFAAGGKLKQKFKWPGGLGIAPGSSVEINGSGTTAAANLSFLYTLWRYEDKPRLNVGAVWRSQAFLPLKGDFLVNGNGFAKTSTEQFLPQSFSYGIAYWPVRDREREWKLEVDVDYVRWSSMRDLNIKLSTGDILRNPQSWHDAVSFGLGAEYRWLQPSRYPGWEFAVRGGFHRSHTPIPDKNINPAFPDSNVNVFSIGVGWFCKAGALFLGLISCETEGEDLLRRRGIGFDMSYQLLYFEPRRVSGHPNPAVDGRYKTLTQALSLTFRLNL